MKDLIVPIYIDTNALLDLLASVEGGFSFVEKVTTRKTTSTSSEKTASGEAGAEFGIPNVFNLLKIRLGGTLSSQVNQGTGEERETDRYHTYGSLLYRLRAFLEEEKLIKKSFEKTENWEKVKPSDFVEVRGVFRPNPIVDSLQRLDRLLGIFEVVTSMPQVSSQPPGKKSAQDTKKQMESFRHFLRKVLEDIEKKNTRAFVIDTTEPTQAHVVVLLFTDYLRDQTMAEISHKEYRLLGKIVRKIEQDSGETIDLLQGTALGGIGREMLEQLWNALNQMEQMNLRRVESEVSGPALEVVPIAVYI